MVRYACLGIDTGGIAGGGGKGREEQETDQFDSRSGFGDAVAIGLGSMVGRCGGWGCAAATVVIPQNRQPIPKRLMRPIRPIRPQNRRNGGKSCPLLTE